MVIEEYDLFLQPMNQELSENQQIQDEEYAFPYHYIPRYRGTFSPSMYHPFGINYVSTLEFLKEKLEELTFGSICDVGAGDGRLVRELSHWFPRKIVSGVDYSSRATLLARGLNPGLDFVLRDIVSDPPYDKYDVLTLIEVFEHIPPELCKGFVYALHGMLKEGGTLLLTVPHANKKVSPKHYQHFDSSSLRHYFNEFFEVQEEVFFERHRHWRLFWIRRLLKNKLFLLNHRGMLNWLYSAYKKHLFITDEEHCSRIYLRLQKR